MRAPSDWANEFATVRMIVFDNSSICADPWFRVINVDWSVDNLLTDLVCAVDGSDEIRTGSNCSVSSGDATPACGPKIVQYCCHIDSNTGGAWGVTIAGSSSIGPTPLPGSDTRSGSISISHYRKAVLGSRNKDFL